jgi:pimeloyl-ACP methyl ester carboxylesterase
MIHILPGMGANHRMYSAPAWRSLPDARFLDWPVHHDETSIAAIATRVIDEAGILDGDIIIGSSLGGIVGCEIARTVSLKALVLIGSAKDKDEVSGLLTLLHPLARLAPIEFVQMSVGKFPSELTQMFNQSQASFIRAMCAAIFDWPGLDESTTKPVRIHGMHDHVIPIPAKVDLALDGGHLIAMTHPLECVQFITTLATR